MIPTDKESWLQDRWTLRRNDSFWKSVRSATLTPRSLYEDKRDVHELAHLVTCKDEHVNDPDWGIKSFNTSPGFKRFPVEDYLLEFTTEIVTHAINRHIKGHKIYSYLEDYQVPTFVVDDLLDISPIDMSREYLEGFAFITWKVWTLDRIWQELNRKYILWESK